MRLHLLTCCVLAAVVTLAGACGGSDEHLPVDARAGADTGVADGPTDARFDDASSGTCGGITGEQCAADQYCDFPDNSCGVADRQGTCRPRPASCPDLVVAEPTCGCDGVVHDQPCAAHLAGTNLNANGGCPVPEGAFACGYTQCGIPTQYCQREVSDVVDEADGYACRPLPGCPSQFPTCACLAGEPCGSMCAGNGTTGLTLTCPGG